MKKNILILFISLFAINLAAQNKIKPSETLDNKGLYAYDSLRTSFPDSLMSVDSLVNNTKLKQNLFVSSRGIDDSSTYISRVNQNSFFTEDYRNLSDIFTYLPFSFLQDLGSFGQPNEQMFYGLGFENISYLRDGVLLNDRWLNSYNLNKLNSELIDSIEIAPITKGFLYSTYNNPISISMNSKSKFPSRPITKLKFYQASFDEGFVDVIFHTPITKKLSFGIDVSNSAIDSRFANSDYESWKLSTQIIYQASDKINIIANYFYSYDTLGLFGGLDTNKIESENINNVLYETVGTSKSSRYQLTYNNNANIKVIAKLFPNIYSDLTLYFNSTSQKFIQNKDTLFNHLPIINNSNYQQTFGVSFRNIYSHRNISLDIIANYESSSFNTDDFQRNNSINIFTLSGELKFPVLNNKYFVPAIYAKTNNFNGENLFGYGAEISGRVNNSVGYYGGISWFQQQLTALEGNYYSTPNEFSSRKPMQISDNTAIEFGVQFKFNFLSGKLSYFSYQANNRAIPIIYQTQNDTLLINEVSYFSEKKINNNGINLNFDLRLWKFLFSNNLSFYLGSREKRVYASPDYTIAGKLYYLDVLFEGNLSLKMGINYRFTGGQLPFVYDFEKSLQITNELTHLVNYETVPSSFQLDLFLAGTIQERATIFVTLENVLDTDYYIAPYYFKQPITLRLGVSWLLFD